MFIHIWLSLFALLYILYTWREEEIHWLIDEIWSQKIAIAWDLKEGNFMQNNVVQDQIFQVQSYSSSHHIYVDWKNQDDRIYVVYSSTLSGFVMFVYFITSLLFHTLYMKYLEVSNHFGFFHAKYLW